MDAGELWGQKDPRGPVVGSVWVAQVGRRREQRFAESPPPVQLAARAAGVGVMPTVEG